MASARVQRNVLGERAPVREPGLLLVGAHLGLTPVAPLAAATPTGERHGHAVVDRPPAYARPDRRHHTRQLVPGHVRHRDLVVPGPGVPVAAAQARGVHADDDAALGGDGLGNLTDLRRGADGVVDDCSHRAIFARRIRARQTGHYAVAE
jgi:hypothetical protein